MVSGINANQWPGSITVVITACCEDVPVCLSGSPMLHSGTFWQQRANSLQTHHLQHHLAGICHLVTKLRSFFGGDLTLNQCVVNMHSPD